MSVLGCTRARVLWCSSAVVLGCSGVLAVVAAQEQPRVAATTTGVIAGRVVDASSGQAIAEATVSLRSLKLIEAKTTDGSRTRLTDLRVVTDSQGRFVFATLAAGAYTLTATVPPGHVQASAQVELAQNDRVADVTMRLGRFGSIAGTVRDDAGDPVVGAHVGAFLRRTAGFMPVLMPRGGTVADDRGLFRMGELPPGDYLVCACGRDPLPIDKALLSLLGPVPPSAGAVTQRVDSTVPVFPPTFHPGSTRASGATTVSLDSADNRTGIDITMRAITPTRVSGQLIGIGINDGTELKLLLIPENDVPEALGVTAIEPVTVNRDGTFSFVGVPPGRYSLEVFPADGKTSLWASVPVVVSDRDVDGLVVSLWSGATVTGRLVFSGGATPPDAATLEKGSVGLGPVALTPRMLISAGTSGSVGSPGKLERDGSFRVEGVPPGRYVVSASGFGTAWRTIETVTTSEGPSQDPVVTIGATGLTGMVITMSDAALSSVEGTVALAKYEAPQSVRVLLFPTDPSTWGESFRAQGRFAFAFVSTTRTFKLANVPAGDYFITLVPADANISADRLEQWSQRATRLRLRPGEKTTVVLKR